MTDTPRPSISFLGIGLMGRPMAANLIAAGYPVTVWNRSPGKTEALVEALAKFGDLNRIKKQYLAAEKSLLGRWQSW